MRFHQRYRSLIVLAIFAGTYFEGVRRLFPSKIARVFFVCYSAMALLLQWLTFCSPAARIFFYFEEIYRSLASCSSNFLSMAKITYFIYKRREYQALADFWDDLFMNDGDSKSREELLKLEMAKLKKYIVGSGVTICTILFLFSLSQYSHKDFFSVPNGIPYRKNTNDFYFLATIYLIAYTLLALVVTSVDTFFLLPCVWEKVELLRLQQVMAELIKSVQSEKISEDFTTLYEFDKRLRTWIDQHQKLLRFHDAFSRVYRRLLEMQVSSMVAAACLFSFTIVMGAMSAFDAISAITFFIPNYMMFFITCQHGDLIRETSSNIFGKAFSEDWYTLPKKYKTILHMVILRANHQVEIKAYKLYPFGARTFFQILTTAYSFYSFLNSVEVSIK